MITYIHATCIIFIIYLIWDITEYNDTSENILNPIKKDSTCYTNNFVFYLITIFS